MRRLRFLGAVYALTLLAAVPAQAQLNGSHTLGDFGVQSGSQPQPGFYAALFYLRYDTDTIKDADGNTPPRSGFSRQPRGLGRGSDAVVREQGQVLRRQLRRDGGASLGERGARSAGLRVGETVDTSFSDMLVRPLDLGWHTKRADITAGFQFYAPTGRTSAAAATTSERACGRTSRSSARPSTSTRSEPPVSRPPPSGISREEERHQREGRTAPHARGRSG